MISLGLMLLCACTPVATKLPTAAIKPTSTVTLTSTQVFFTQTPTITRTPTLEPISGGWSTFFSPEFGFSLQYPAIFDKGFTSFESVCDISVIENSIDNLLVIIGDNRVLAEKTNKNLTEYTNYYIENNRSGWDVKQTEIEINGLIANRLEYHLESPPRYGIVTILVKENKAITFEHFEMNFFYCDLKDNGYSSYWIYERTIESLKFRP